MTKSGTTIKTLLVVVLLLTVGVSFLPLLGALLMDLLSISIFTGLETVLGQPVHDLESLWPGGKIVSALVKMEPLTPAIVISGILQLTLVATIRMNLPTLTSRQGGVLRLFAMTLADLAITCAIGIAVAFLFNFFLNGIFDTPASTIAQIILGAGEFVSIVLCFFIALGLIKATFSGVAFKLILALARYLLVTIAVFAWQWDPMAGRVMAFSCIVAAMVLTMVSGKLAGRW